MAHNLLASVRMSDPADSVPHNRRTSDDQTQERRQRSDRRRNNSGERRANAPASQFIDAKFSAQIVGQSLDDRADSKPPRPGKSEPYAPSTKQPPRTGKTV